MAFFNPMTREVNLRIVLRGSSPETLCSITDALLARDREARSSQRGRVDDFGFATNDGWRVVPLHLALTPVRGFQCRVFVAWPDSAEVRERMTDNDDAVVIDPKTVEEVEAAAREAHARLSTTRD